VIRKPFYNVMDQVYIWVNMAYDLKPHWAVGWVAEEQWDGTKVYALP